MTIGDSGAWLQVVVRRFVNERLELVPPGSDASSASVVRLSSYTPGEEYDHESVRIYEVELREGYRIRPVDWRRFAYDHDEVVKIVSHCVRDNVSPFEPLTKETMGPACERLRVALADLSSVFDANDVQLEATEPEMIQVTVDGEHKNGRRVSFVVPVYLAQS